MELIVLKNFRILTVLIPLNERAVLTFTFYFFKSVYLFRASR